MLREATLGDLDRLIGLLGEFHEEITFSDIPLSETLLVERITSYIENDSFLVLVAEENSQLYGAFIAYVNTFFFSHSRGAWDLAFYIHPSRRGGSAAYRMIKYYLSWAAKKNTAAIFLGTVAAADIEATGRLYERCGFRSSGKMFRFSH